MNIQKIAGEIIQTKDGNLKSICRVDQTMASMDEDIFGKLIQIVPSQIQYILLKRVAIIDDYESHMSFILEESMHSPYLQEALRYVASFGEHISEFSVYEIYFILPVNTDGIAYWKDMFAQLHLHASFLQEREIYMFLDKICKEDICLM